MLKGAIFDLDGVVVDTVPLHFEAWKKMFGEYNIDFTFEMYKAKVDGIPRYDGARAILTDISDKELKTAADRKQSYYLEFVSKESIPVYDSSVALIKDLKKHKIKIAIASSSRNCRKILEITGLISLADTIVHGGEFKKGKPDPEIFQLSAKRLKLSHNECIVFEDAVLGVEAAINGGMPCVGIDRYGKQKRLKKADFVVKDLSEVDYYKLERLFKK